MANYHVSGNRRDGYKIKREGASKNSGEFSRKADAESRAKELSANSGGGEVRIHRADGKIGDSDTVKPGNDPMPPRDKKH